MSATTQRITVLTVESWQPLSMNELERMNRHVRFRYRKDWQFAVLAHWLNHGDWYYDYPTITIRCYYKVNRKRDADNAAGGVGKIVMDALKGRAFRDDDTGSVDLQPVQLLVDRDNPRVEIELSEGGSTWQPKARSRR